jgi:hypothetical protein
MAPHLDDAPRHADALLPTISSNAEEAMHHIPA